MMFINGKLQKLLKCIGGNFSLDRSNLAGTVNDLDDVVREDSEHRPIISPWWSVPIPKIQCDDGNRLVWGQQYCWPVRFLRHHWERQQKNNGGECDRKAPQHTEPP